VTALKTIGAELHRNYEAGQWVPHVSVATRAQDAQPATVAKAITDVLPLTSAPTGPLSSTVPPAGPGRCRTSPDAGNVAVALFLYWRGMPGSMALMDLRRLP
jgi:hypothetical protein